jgi:hypothetical protein
MAPEKEIGWATANDANDSRTDISVAATCTACQFSSRSRFVDLFLWSGGCVPNQNTRDLKPGK